MDKSYTYLNRIWFDRDQIVGFCFTENPITDIFFSLRPGYEEIAPEMVAYADGYMPGRSGEKRFVFLGGPTAAIYNSTDMVHISKLLYRINIQISPVYLLFCIFLKSTFLILLRSFCSPCHSFLIT